MSSHCVIGKQYLGSPQGKFQRFGDVHCYVGTPTFEYDQKKALILLTDMFGITFSNNKLLVDNFARAGYWTIAPDYLCGDPAPPYAWNNRGFNVHDWIDKHPAEVTWPVIREVIQALRDQGVTSFAVTGYCLGGRYAIDLACHQIVDVLIIAHPSQVKDDYVNIFQNLADKGKAPFLFEMGSEDTELSVSDQETIDGIFCGDKPYAPGYKRKCWDGCPHGFAVRGDMLVEEEFAGKKGSFHDSIEWLKQYF
ncbi:hypothetical protein PISMIDRAFT_199985 [Pisolithus microcarpus 441]|uniref:Dienelactone hydrolase domain-containing protein n=1 Tax=Pisolithus microcarpus 441 TaxID=765257 RepID=A0A0C9ZMM3_9AGAM|nr:hypothetical protein PISMIDRAFT_199985 [Pisolithus microcarpus 441]